MCADVRAPINKLYHYLVEPDWMLQVSNPGMGKRFSLFQNVYTGSEAHPVSYSLGNRGYFPRVKRPERDVNHLPPASAAVTNEWSYIFTSPVCLNGVDREKCTFFSIPCFSLQCFILQFIKVFAV
jgi:hypothetical protein